MPLNVIGSLRAPALSWDTEAETLRDEIEGTVTSLLGLVGIAADPLSSREHVLLSNLIENAWRAGRDLDLGALIGEIQSPPLRKLGVFEIDAFFPPKDRTELALKLNALIASPAFAAWGEGAPLDPQSLLFTPEGKPRAAIVYLAHLSDEERMFVTTLVFAKLVTWMRGQSGTSDLRALAYMDEVAGYVPPTAAPPAKKPILTILKQGRAFGLGLVLSTQNPVDLDYKAMSNAGTWLVGRLQTENDKARVLEGLRSAAGGTDIAALDAAIGALQKRQFMLVSAKDSRPRVFGTRWAMSYLRGPLTKEQVQLLMREAPRPAEPLAAAEAAPAAPLAADETSVVPAAAPGVTVSYLDPAAPWASQVGAVAGVTRLRAFLATRVALRYDDTAAGIDEQQEFEALYGPLDGGLDLDAETVVDFDDRDFRPEAPAGAAYVLPAAPVGEAKFFAQAGKDVQARLVANRALEVFRNKELKLTSRPGEPEDAFLVRCDEAGQERADAGDREADEAPRGEEGSARERARALAAPGRGARHADEVAPGERADHGRRSRARRALRRQAQRPVDHERSRLGRVEARPVGDVVAAARHRGGEGAADDRRPGAARAGDPRRGGGDRRQVEDGRRDGRHGRDPARGDRRPRHRREARLGSRRLTRSGLRLSSSRWLALRAGGCRVRCSRHRPRRRPRLASRRENPPPSPTSTTATRCARRPAARCACCRSTHRSCTATASARRRSPRCDGSPRTERASRSSATRRSTRTDRYGRQLRYVFVSGTNVNVALVRAGCRLALLLPRAGAAATHVTCSTPSTRLAPRTAGTGAPVPEPI